MQLVAHSAMRDPTALAVVISMVFGLFGGLPLKLDNTREVHAVLAQIADPLRFVPLEFHAGTNRM
jgi:hypothetical protein